MPDQDTMDFKLILEVRNAGDQAFIKSLLDAEGIVYYMQGEHVAPYAAHGQERSSRPGPGTAQGLSAFLRLRRLERIEVVPD